MQAVKPSPSPPSAVALLPLGEARDVKCPKSWPPFEGAVRRKSAERALPHIARNFAVCDNLPHPVWLLIRISCLDKGDYL